MNYKKQEEIDEFARKLVVMRDEAKKSKNKTLIQNYLNYQKFCIEEFRYLISIRANRYRRFSNFQDLEQDGYEALMLALRTYNPSKGSFTWWADKYISTRISRSANTHSTIRFPLKKAKELKPFKTTKIPVLVDISPDALDNVQASEIIKHISDAVEELPDPRIIRYVYGLGTIPHSITDAAKIFGLSRMQCVKILEESKLFIKEKLKKFNEHAEINTNNT